MHRIAFTSERNTLASTNMKSVVALVVAAWFLSLICPPVSAQEPSVPSPIVAPAPSIAPDADPATATRAWLDTVPPDKRAKSDAYFEGGYWLILWDYLMTEAILLFLLTSRISARMRDFAERSTRSMALRVTLYAIPFGLLT